MKFIKENKVINKVKYSFIIIFVLIAITILGIGTVSRATNEEISNNEENELTAQPNVNVYDNLGKKVKTYNAKVVISKEKFCGYFNDKPYTGYVSNGGFYCIKEGEHLYDKGYKNKFTGQWFETIVMDPYLQWTSYDHLNVYPSGPVFKSTGSTERDFSPDYKEAGSSVEQRTTYSNAAYEIAETKLSSITTRPYGTYTGHLIPYAATFNRPGDNTHKGPAQEAIWAKTNEKPGNELYKAGYSVDALHREIATHGDLASKSQIVRPIRNKETGNGCGTIIEGGNFKVGPFKMCDYAYVASQYAKMYSGAELTEQKDLVGGIVSGKIKLTSDNGGSTELKIGTDCFIETTYPGDNNRSEAGIWGKPENYPLPYPNAEFYVLIPMGTAMNFNTLESFSFVYRKTTAEGKGYVADGREIVTRFNQKDEPEEKGCNTYFPDPRSCTWMSDTIDLPTRQSSSIGVNEGGNHSTTHTHTAYCPNYTPCPHGCAGHPATRLEQGADYWHHKGQSFPKEKMIHDGCDEGHLEHIGNGMYYCQGHHSYVEVPYTEYRDGCHCACPGHTHEHTVTAHYTCHHGYEHCRLFKWHAVCVDAQLQPLLGVEEAHVDIWEDNYETPVQVRLTTDLQIDKYITKDEHVVPNEISDKFIIFGENESRSRANGFSESQKQADPVKVERGDRITFKIDIINAQAQRVKCQIEDILPDLILLEKIEPTINGWIEVPQGKSSIKIVLRTKALEGIYNNYAGIITNNAGPQNGKGDYNKTVYSPSDNRNNGPVVNLAELQGGILESRDYYRIKEYSVNIDKYIYDVEHNPDTKGLGGDLDTTYVASDKRAHNNITEEQKKAYPEYIEYGDIVTYKIRIYNTTNEYDGQTDNAGEPYFSPDRIYVNILDTLPPNVELLPNGVTIGPCKGEFVDKTATYSFNNKEISIKNFMIPANSSREILVKVKVNDSKLGTIGENEAKLDGDIRNINRGNEPTTSVPDDFCVIKNNTKKDVSKDWYILNNYDCFIDKYLSRYDEKVLLEDNENELSEGGQVADHSNDHQLLRDRSNNKATDKKVNIDGLVEDIIKDRRHNEEDKRDHPVGVEKNEHITYTIKIINDADTIDRGNNGFGNKPATQVRPTTVFDIMPDGIVPINATAIHYTENGQPCDRHFKGDDKKNGAGNYGVDIDNFERVKDENGLPANKYTFKLDNSFILNPKEYIVINIECEVRRSNLTLERLANFADLDVLTNINHTTDDERIVTPENIAEQSESREYIKMKDLILSGRVWLDYDRDGLYNEFLDANHNGVRDEGEKSIITNHHKVFYGVDDNGGKKDILVKLYRIDPGTETAKVVRTTRTDEEGKYTFARDEQLNYYDSEKYFEQFDPNNMYQRVEKADKKDENGNYTKDSKLYEYYIEYEFDGLTYQCTIYADRVNMNEDGSVKDKYKIDSNAYEFADERAEFNENHEYMSYNSSYKGASEGYVKSEDLVFDKNGHISELTEDPSRIMTARSFMHRYEPKYEGERKNHILAYGNTDYLWLVRLDYIPNDVTVPETSYTKDINLGLALRGDVDLALTKDVYDVRTLIDGERMQYGFNKNSGINGLMGDGVVLEGENQVNKNILRDYIIDKPYGLELYESDYKQRVDQYVSDAVKVHKGINGESELNVEITYRLQLNNINCTDDDSVKDIYENFDKEDSRYDVHDERLKVKINEILDLYDANFMEPVFKADGTLDEEKNKVPVKVKNKDGILVNPRNEEEELKTIEAWYYKPMTEEEMQAKVTVTENGQTREEFAIPLNRRYSSYVDETNGNSKPFYLQDDNGTYQKVDLVVKAKSQRQNGEPFSARTIDASKDGYKVLYLSPKDENEIIIEEGGEFDVYVKYVVDKDTLSMKIDEEAAETYKETSSETTNVTEETKTEGAITVSKKEVTVDGQVKTETTATIKRSLKIMENIINEFKNKYGRGLENLAQINAYAVYYQSRDGLSPVGIVDKDSNAGNIGIRNDFPEDSEAENKFIQPGDPEYKEVVLSYDDIDYYEDTSYKTGVELAAEGTVNTKKDIELRYNRTDIFITENEIPTPDEGIERRLNGVIWDDTRSVGAEEGQGAMFFGNGEYSNDDRVHEGIENKDDGKLLKPMQNEIIPMRYKTKLDLNGVEKSEFNESKDIPVSNAKAEFIEIVDVATVDENDNVTDHKYYEEVLKDVTWPQVQHIRSDKDGKYELKGMIPGDYIVRFTYGDTIDQTEPEDLSKYDVSQNSPQRDMLIFNGQDYKSTKFTTPTPADLTSVDQIILSMEDPGHNDARDDEIRRLAVNSYSEVMTNEKAEVLKGLANGTELSTFSTPNSVEDYKKLTDNTYMNAETPQFLIRTEKLTGEQSKDAYNQDFIYEELEKLKYKLNGSRDFIIDNIDFGIEYRPESQINLLKEIEEVKLTTQDDKLLIKVVIKSDIDKDGNLKRYIDMNNSVGMELVQFISNDYNKKLVNLLEEKVQGFVYLQVDDDLLQGAKVDIKYKFRAQNYSELDKISKLLDEIRYKENPATLELLNKYPANEIFIGDYTASGTAKNVLLKEFYVTDPEGIMYRTQLKSPYTVDNGGYFGKYLGSTYFTTEDKENTDVVASLKFDMILDYIDTDLEYERTTDSKLLKDQYWNKVKPSELVPYLSMFKEQRKNAKIPGTTVVSENECIIVNKDKEQYNNLVVSIDDKRYDGQNENEYFNNDLSRFLYPRHYYGIQTPELQTKSIGSISLPVSKVLAQENDTKNMSYENLAEIIRFTTQTGRRTNFITTIGNTNMAVDAVLPPNDSLGSHEFKLASYELDTAATETITLTPPTGLMRNRQAIVNTVEVAGMGVKYAVSIGAVVIVILFIIRSIRFMIKNRRYK